jgi:Amt family ammonium transporter
VAAGLDIYDPGLAFIVATAAGVLSVQCAKFLERCGIDDAVGAVAVHGFAGVFSLVLVGILAAGMPNAEGMPPISLTGQLLSSVVMIALGGVPGYGVSLLLKKLNILRVPEGVEELGIDEVELLAKPYPEANVPATQQSDVPNKLANV